MPEPSARVEMSELSQIRDPDARRAIRALYRELNETVERHQLEIEALVQIMLEKRVMSMSEYKLHLSKLHQGRGTREERIHDELSSLNRHTAPPEDAGGEQPAQMPEKDVDGRYRLDG